MKQIENKNGKYVIAGKEYTPSEVIRAVRFWEEFRWHEGSSECPICGTDFESAGLFVCEHCGELLPTDEESPYATGVCKECDELYQDQKAYENAASARIDAMCGK